jgi:hypothetical protein
MREVLCSLIEQAIGGNLKAAEMLLNRAYGKPKEHMDVTSNGLTIAPTVINFVDDGEPESEIPTAMETED